jgi:hypothetical protein
MIMRSPCSVGVYVSVYPPPPPIVTRQQLGKPVPLATNTCTTIAKLLDALFSLQSVLCLLCVCIFHGFGVKLIYLVCWPLVGPLHQPQMIYEYGAFSGMRIGIETKVLGKILPLWEAGDHHPSCGMAIITFTLWCA